MRARAIWVLAVATIAGQALPAAASERPTYDYAVPVQRTSPWPEMRRDSRNTGASPIAGRYQGDSPWSFRTGRGIFSTPVIGGDGRVYFGSADGFFYSLRHDGRLSWNLRTTGIIDAAAAIGAYQEGRRTNPITIGSGDETLYQLRTTPRRLNRERRIIWRFRTSAPPATGQLVNWWEGNVAIGPDGAIYAGNTGGGAYALEPGGALRWIHQRGNSVWTTPAFGEGAEAGNTYWGSVDLFAFSLDSAGRQRWQSFTPGYVTSSPALGPDGTVYVGSFDGRLYALDPDTGAAEWSFATDDHIYSSPALDEQPGGGPRAIYIASADGSVYAVNPQGGLIWRYDTGDPVRSSPALGRGPNGSGGIVYVGSSNGKLYAIDAATGSRRWSFDTTPNDPALRDRNDLNGSPALGKTGVYIGGEHGRLWYVPYDYCLRRLDRRCSRNPGQALGGDLDRVFRVTPGGTTLYRGGGVAVPTTTTVATRLVVRRGGTTEDAGLRPDGPSESLVHTSPRFPFTSELSGDGHFLFVRPTGFLRPGAEYRLRLAADWQGSVDGRVDDTVRFRTARSRGPLPLHTSARRVSAFGIRRLAMPLPPLLPSVNQIGFDSYDMIAGTIARTPPGRGGVGRVLLWVVGARRNAAGDPVPDPGGNFQFALAGRYRDDFLELSASNLNLEFSFGKVPLESFDIRGQLGQDMRMRPGAGLAARVICGDVPGYALQLRVAGVCNERDTLAVSGSLLTDPFPRRGEANRRPPGVRLASLRLRRPAAGTNGSVLARLSIAPGARYPARSHVGSILLTDARDGSIVPLAYRESTSVETGADGEVGAIRLSIAAGTELPARIRAYVITDVFPLAIRSPAVAAPSGAAAIRLAGKLDFGVSYFATDETVEPAEMARTLEQRGFESMFVPEHTHIPASRETPYPVGGELPREYSRIYDPFVALAGAAAATERLRIGTAICLLVQRDPIITAKEVASLDRLSGGRVIFGVGAGWNVEEMSNHGTDASRRFGLLRERVEAIKEIWTSEEAAYDGEQVGFERIWCWPKPLQEPHPPILIGGNGRTVYARVLAYGDGWMPNRIGDDEKNIARIEKLQRLGADAGRGSIPVSLQLAPLEPELLERYETAGVTRAVYMLPAADRDRLERAVERYTGAMTEYMSAGA